MDPSQCCMATIELKTTVISPTPIAMPMLSIVFSLAPMVTFEGIHWIQGIIIGQWLATMKIFVVEPSPIVPFN